MEPHVQYVTTPDGINIAYYTMGQGPAQLVLLLPPSHLEAEWQVNWLRNVYIATTQESTLIRLDPRGFGLSDREPPNFALDSIVLDIETVVDRLGIERLRIYSWGLAAIPALAYTARHPQIVTHLVQTPPMSSADDFFNDRFNKLLELSEIDWGMSAEIITRLMNPDFGDREVRQVAELGEASISAQDLTRFNQECRSWNADDDAVNCSTPTLLLHQRGSKAFDVVNTRRVAALIPNSRVAFIDNAIEGVLTTRGFYQDALDSPDSDSTSALSPTTQPTVTFRTVLFTDLVGHTQMMSRLGDEAGRAVLREHERITREVLAANGGTEVKTMGHGFMASFGSVTKSVECAIALQRAFAEHDGEPLAIRVGLNAGEPIEEDGDLFGATVILASRIAAKAEGGEILVADTVRGLCSGKGFLFADRGEFVAKGFEEPVRVYEVSWRT